MEALELKQVNGGFALACFIYDDEIETSSLSKLNVLELRVLFSRTEREDIKQEVIKLLKNARTNDEGNILPSL